jgi:hypothetical protein
MDKQKGDRQIYFLHSQAQYIADIQYLMCKNPSFIHDPHR